MSIEKIVVSNARGLRGATGNTGNGANPFPAIDGEDPGDVLDESYMPGDIRRYGIEPDDGIDHTSINPSRVAAWLASSTLPNVRAYAPRGTYNFAFGLTATDGSSIYFDHARFTGTVHITGGSSEVDWGGVIECEDRFGIANDGASFHIRLGVIRMIGACRVVHIAGVTDLAFDLIRVENTDTCDGAGDQSNLAAVYIEGQGLSGCRGRIQIDASETNGVFVNMLDIDLDVDIASYGGTAIDAGANAAQGLNTAQTELGTGLLLQRCTGKVRGKVRQGHASPGADTYSVWVPETGVSTVASSRHKPLDLSGLDADVGNGNKGVVFGSEGGTTAVCNVIAPGGGIIRLRAANTLASGYAGLTVSPPPATVNCYTKVSGEFTFTNFDNDALSFKATAVATAQRNNFTEIDVRLNLPEQGAAAAIVLTGTGGILKGRVDLGDVYCTAQASFAGDLIAVTGCTDLRLTGGKIEAPVSGNPGATALHFTANVNCTFAVAETYGFHQVGAGGAMHIDGGNVGCTFGPTLMTGGSGAAGEGVRFTGTQTDCRFIGLRPTVFLKGFENGTAMAFTRGAAIGCVATGNTDDTDLATSDFPAAAQLGCSNFAV